MSALEGLREEARQAFDAQLNDPAQAADLERAIYNESVRALRAAPKQSHAMLYAAAADRAAEHLGAQVGPYPDDVVKLMLTQKRMTPIEALSEATMQLARPDPRELMRRQFVRVLMAADAYAADPGRALADGAAIELSCYNATVRISKGESDPPRRNWDTPQFIDIYSTRCGAVYCLLDPVSAPCREYGPQVVPRLLAGELAPAALGDLAERDLCPQAMAAERAEIAARCAQRVVAKESAIFQCPHCKERRCTYTEVQRRSLDEPPDYICMCLNERCRRQFTGRQ